jgi:hypothetical protein
LSGQIGSEAGMSSANSKQSNQLFLNYLQLEASLFLKCSNNMGTAGISKLWDSAMVCYGLPQSATVCHSLPQSATVCHSLPQSATVYSSYHIYHYYRFATEFYQ